MRVPVATWWKLVIAITGLALLAAACGSDGAPSGSATPSAPPPSTPASPATSPPNAAVCADAAALRASLEKFGNLKIGAGTVDEITADLKEVQANLTALAKDAAGQWQAETSALKSALARLGTAVGKLASQPGTGTAAAVSAALSDVSTAARNLLGAVYTRCSSASPSPST